MVPIVKAKEKKHLVLRIPVQHDSWDWELLSSDGTALDGWVSASVGIDHSGRHCLHVIFDQFECVNADGQAVKIELTNGIPRPIKKVPPLPNPCTHKKHRPKPSDVDWEWE